MPSGYVRGRLRSFGFAFKGIATLVKEQPNARIHLAATLCVLGLGLYLKVSLSDWIWLITAVTWVWIAESLNTAIEYLGDKITKEHSPLIGKAKDVAAAGVLIAAIGATAIGTIILLPYFLR